MKPERFGIEKACPCKLLANHGNLLFLPWHFSSILLRTAKKITFEHSVENAEESFPREKPTKSLIHPQEQQQTNKTPPQTEHNHQTTTLHLEKKCHIMNLRQLFQFIAERAEMHFVRSFRQIGSLLTTGFQVRVFQNPLQSVKGAENLNKLSGQILGCPQLVLESFK